MVEGRFEDDRLAAAGAISGVWDRLSSWSADSGSRVDIGWLSKHLELCDDAF